MYGTFANGRVEQFFPSRALKPQELRVPIISRGIARRMRELHSVDLKMLGYESGREGEPVIWRLVSDWVENAQEILSALSGLGGKWELWVEQYGLHRLRNELEAYRSHVMNDQGKGKGLVFSRES